jgi:glycine cleavage system T protein (aminomethyltransferase)
VPFGGYELPLHYPQGILAEHQHTRNKASLFDVSHMGQLILKGDERAKALEQLIPSNVQELKPFAQRYSTLTNGRGGIIDDLIIANREDHLYLVINGACREKDLQHLRVSLPDSVELTLLNNQALMALQGPQAVEVLSQYAPGCADLGFMKGCWATIDGAECWISRAGYTGEDGFEISCAAEFATTIANLLLQDSDVEFAGLGARDSLRLEAGLCLYGHDLNDQTTPIEADLQFIIQKRRRENGGFLGSEIILDQIAHGPHKKRIGLVPAGRAPIREGVELYNGAGEKIGVVTSGAYSPTLKHPIAMGYVDQQYAGVGTEIFALVRNKQLKCRVATLPFHPHNYAIKTKK